MGRFGSVFIVNHNHNSYFDYGISLTVTITKHQLWLIGYEFGYGLVMVISVINHKLQLKLTFD